jgi:hypothetical protein
MAEQAATSAAQLASLGDAFQQGAGLVQPRQAQA